MFKKYKIHFNRTAFFFTVSILAALPILTNAQDSAGINAEEEDFIGSYYNQNFHPFNKGNWYTGLSFSLTNEQFDNSKDILEIDRVINGKTLDYSIKFKGGYFFAKNSMAGLGYSIERNKSTTDAEFLFVSLSIVSIDRIHSFTPFIRSYFPLTRNKRLSLFNEMKMDFGFGKGESERIENGVQTSFDNSNNFIFGIGLSPGVTFFALENFCFEIQLDVLGYRYERETKSDETGEETTTYSHNVDFTLNLLTLNFGIAYYFGGK